MTHQTDIDVLIVGAGPTGLTLACLLAQFGVSFKIIEKRKSASAQSRALGIQARTLELFEQLDIAEKAVALGYPAKGVDLMVQGKLKCSLDLKSLGKELTKYPYLLILEQHKTEQLLLEKLNSLGSDVDWGHELIEIQQHPHSVTAILSHYERVEVLKTKFLVAADGAKSRTRSLLKLPFIGPGREDLFFLTDVAVEGALSREHVTICLSREGFASFFPIRGGANRFRTIGIWPEKENEKASAEFEKVAREIKRQAHLDLKISDPRWISFYQTRYQAVSRFREQHCFFVGDAAHIHSPMGAQGMNTGIQDAFNLAWKLQMVLKGRAQEELLNTYHEERFPVAQNLVRNLDQFLNFLASPRFFTRWLRLFIFPLAFRILVKVDSFQVYLFESISQIGVRYRKSNLSEQEFLSEADFKAGDRCIPPKTDGRFHAYLVEGPREQERIVEILEKYFETGIKIHTLTKELDVPQVLQRYGIFKDGLILVRPDGYTAYCAENPDPKSLENYLNRYFIPKNHRLPKELESQEEFPFETFI